jgi:hypothetical protein
LKQIATAVGGWRWCVSASDGAEKLSALAEELSGNDPELGAQMLLLAAAALAESRAS